MLPPPEAARVPPPVVSSMPRDAPTGTAIAASPAATLLIDKSLPARLRVKAQPVGTLRLPPVSLIVVLKVTVVAPVHRSTALVKDNQGDVVRVARAGGIPARLYVEIHATAEINAASPVRTVLHHTTVMTLAPFFPACSCQRFGRNAFAHVTASTWSER
jgi:hypothetical protein